jgi:hypothetical protein
MNRVIAIVIVVLVGTFGLLVYFDPGPHGLYEIYERKLQTPLFTGFLTVGGFLLTLKTFVIIRLKESLYDSSTYKERLERKRHLNPNLSAYGPLSRLASFLILSVVSAIITAALQMSIGFIQNKFAAAICISVATTTLILVLWSWWLIRTNLSDWFSILETDSKKPTDKDLPETLETST